MKDYLFAKMSGFGPLELLDRNTYRVAPPHLNGLQRILFGDHDQAAPATASLLGASNFRASVGRSESSYFRRACTCSFVGCPAFLRAAILTAIKSATLTKGQFSGGFIPNSRITAIAARASLSF